MNSAPELKAWSRSVDERITAIRHELESASGGRARLLPVTKAFGPEAVQVVRQAGLIELGESYAQELVAKHQEVDDSEISWHMIGRLQRNKVRPLAELVSLWQSVDRPELVDEIARWAPEARILIQVNVLDNPEQGGCRPGEVEGLVVRGHEAGLAVIGLMGIGAEGDRDGTERSFATIARLADQLGLAERSMGMTDDRKSALEHGSTIVRVGRAVFGDRPPSRRG